MSHHLAPWGRRACVVAALSSLGACAVIEDTKVDYRTAKTGVSLEIPPDLTQVNTTGSYVIPGQVVSAKDMATQTRQPSQTAPQALGSARIERQGQQRWLVVRASPDDLWPNLKRFWQDNGFTLTLDQRELGILETEWAENRAKLPQDAIREALGKWFDALYSTGERDKYRTRIERNANGETEIYISHRGMEEVYSNADKTSTVWQPRPNQPELEVEFLRRMMIALGSKPEAANAAVASVSTPNARLVQAQGQQAIEIPEGFDRTWRRVGLSLDRTGFTVVERDRNKGVYDVRFAMTQTRKEDKGFFGKLFSTDKPETAARDFQVRVQASDNQALVFVQSKQEDADSLKAAQKILDLLNNDLK